MYNILISGYYGFDNIGDESILRTLVTSLRERIPDCSLTVLSHDPAATREKYGVEAVERMSPLAIARAVRRCDMLISGGGSLLQDVTSSKSLHYYLAIIRFAQLLGKKVFIYSQGIGPIEKDADRRATARALVAHHDAVRAPSARRRCLRRSAFRRSGSSSRRTRSSA